MPNESDTGLQPTPTPNPKGKRFDALGFVKRRAVPILIMGSALFLVLLPLALLKERPYFEASGTLLIAREMPAITGRLGNESRDDANIVNYFHDYARTQVERILNLQHIETAILALPDDVRDIYRRPGLPLTAAAAIVRAGLSVGQIGRTHLVEVRLQSPNPTGLADMVNAIMETYMGKLRSEKERREETRLSYLRQELTFLDTEINDQTRELAKVIDATKTNPNIDHTNIFLEKALDLQKAATRAHTEMITAQNAYLQALKQKEAIESIPTNALSEELVAGSQVLWRTTSWTYEKLQELRASIDGVTRSNPDRKYIEDRMAAMKRYETQQRKEVQDQAKRIINGKRTYEQQERVVELEHDYLSKKETADTLQAELNIALQQLEDSTLAMFRGKRLLAGIDNNKKKFFDFEERIRDLLVESKSPLRASIETYASAPGEPAGTNLKKLLMLVFLGSFGIAGAGFLAYDFTDNRVRGPKDIADALGQPPSWPISRVVSETKADPFPQLTLDHPASQTAKAIRSLAVRIDKERKKHDAHIVTVTGVSNASGVTALCLNLGHAMKYFCDRVLIIDGNNLRPGLSRLSQTPPAESCLEDALHGHTELAECLTPDTRRGIDLLFLRQGPWPRALYRALPDFLAQVAERYDIVFIDAAPVLENDLTETLLLSSQVTVLVVQGDRTLFPLFTRSAEIIFRLEVPAMATVLNWGGEKPVTRLDGIIDRCPRVLRPMLRGLTKFGKKLLMADTDSKFNDIAA
ncbi:GumC family protein [Desulfovibrio inopinatus]|uniref:GumC family protein n=1 Tax=Desulfovibrio inopinatus TaxID=102109 RepID=UPI00040ED9CC|nr:hypothetical protein [Desulfovibrio inopinatus]